MKTPRGRDESVAFWEEDWEEGLVLSHDMSMGMPL